MNEIKKKLTSFPLCNSFTVQVKSWGGWEDFSFFYDADINKFVCEYKYLNGLFHQGYTQIKGESIVKIITAPKWHLMTTIIDKFGCELYWKDFKKFLEKGNWRIKELTLEGGEV